MKNNIAKKYSVHRHWAIKGGKDQHRSQSNTGICY